MKKIFILLPIFMVAALITGCSNDDGIENDEGIKEEAATNYLSVNLVTAPSVGSRAVQDDGNYENGVGSENSVERVRFYFFNADGSAAAVKKNALGGYDNWYDWTAPSQGEGEKPNVEKSLTATIIIESPKDGTGDGVPSYVVAVINPSAQVEAKSYSLAQLDAVEGNFDTDLFVMSNSVYKNGTEKAEAVSIEGHMYNTSNAALANPVTIYVERVLAKVRLTNGITAGIKTLTDGTVLIPTGTDDDPQTYAGKDIYVKFLGWNATATADKSYLMKKINTAWSDDLFGADEPWNYSPYFRSFWAVNPEGLTFGYGTFDDATSSYPDNSATIAPANYIKYFDGGTADDPKINYAYVQENAAQDGSGANTATPTKVIIAAQLVDENGDALEIAEYAFQKYTVAGLKTEFASGAKLYKKTTDDEQKVVFTSISENDITFKTATEVSDDGPITAGRYYVYAQLTEDAESSTWTESDAENAETISADKANEILESLGHAKIWKNGYTYYYFDVRHLNPEETGVGYVGIVRNHLYDAKVTSLSGLGTPVWNPKETIYPEKPQDEDTFVAAEIKILSWRVVPNSIPLEW